MEKFTFCAALLSLQLATYTPHVRQEVSTTLSVQNKVSEAYRSPLEKFTKKTLFMGDSWTVGYTQGLKDANVIAKVGASSSWVLKNFPKSLPDDIEYVVILCGINNSDNPAQVITDIIEMTIMVRDMGKKYVVGTIWQGKMDKGNIDFINNASTLFCERGGGKCAYISDKINDPETGNIKKEYDAGDNLHVNSKGEKVIHKAIAEPLEQYESEKK